ncbi:amino acid adenylation domain-containing protein [Streptomyces sp. NPDC054841]
MNATHRTLVERFDEVAAAYPESIAVVSGANRTTYAELAAASRRLAARLADSAGVRAGDRVALCLESSTEAIACLIAVLRCGASYVPLDAQNPAERNRLILDDCRPRAVIGDARVGTPGVHTVTADDVTRIAEDADAPQFDAATGRPGDDCYVIYTSGTTGRPKGVPITHRNVQALFEAADGLFTFGPDDTWLLYHSIAFDFSVWELWGPLLYGGTLVVLDRWTKLSPEACASIVLEQGVTVLNQTPTAFSVLSRALMDQLPEGAGLPLRYVVFGGERLSMPALRRWRDRFGLDSPRLINMYGLTEATVHTTYHPLTEADLAGEESVIGRPLPGFVARVVDETGRATERGQLVVAGPQVAAGYLDRPRTTAERFGPDPLGLLDDALFYRTGDLVEDTGDGRLVYLGRADRQVKIRGHRIELGEVEAAVSAVPDVTEAAVVVLGTSDRPVLACGYTTRSGRPLELRTLRTELRSRVPQYMLPGRFEWFEQLPLTVNGKTDTQMIAKEMDLRT